MKLLAFSDAHLRASTPKNRKDDYMISLRQKFEEISNYISVYGVDVVLNGGDLFDRPLPSAQLVNEYVELFLSWEVPVYSVVGSHDKFGYNDGTLPRTALGTLVAAGATTIVNDTIWLDAHTQLAGVSHSYNLDDAPENYNRKRLLEFAGQNSYMIQLVHGMLVDTPFFGHHTLISSLNLECDLAICGHYHPGFGPIKNGRTTFINIGSLGRVERVKRKFTPSVLLIDSITKEVSLLPIHAAADEDIFLQKEEPAEATKTNFDDFLTLLKEKALSFESSNLKSMVEAVGREGKFPTNVVKRAVEFLESCTN